MWSPASGDMKSERQENDELWLRSCGNTEEESPTMMSSPCERAGNMPSIVCRSGIYVLLPRPEGGWRRRTGGGFGAFFSCD